ncbi:PREDICTED: putative phytosulfokines 6 [Ipomoea nil]|uniref:putative phytosulfokines 6 n=1 Tax=Ipomoea nil TaxID=35883 RepID=UPI000900CB02|nr:PREDICTED: putative phytosulfokines 6 [Ipomoea nil]
MKQKTVSFALLLFVFLITSSQFSAGRSLANKQGKEEEVKLENGTNSELMKPETTDSLEKLMGLEKCETTDEECMKRRVVAEAHLDYIYTQQHNP